jgi:hypothetical protein
MKNSFGFGGTNGVIIFKKLWFFFPFGNRAVI